MKRFLILISIVLAASVMVAIGAFRQRVALTLSPEDYEVADKEIAVHPNNFNTTIPYNIAPLNFVIDEEADVYHVEIKNSEGSSEITIESFRAGINIPAEKWAKLLEANVGGKIYFDIFAKLYGSDTWTKFKRFEYSIAKEPIDRYLVYRKMGALFTKHEAMGIYQRDISTFEEKAVIRGKGLLGAFDTSSGGCVNCHCFANNSPERIAVAFRHSKLGADEIIVVDGQVKKIGTKFGYPSWHPSGKIITYSMNKVFQFFHSKRDEVRDVVDLDSAISYYDVRNRKVKTAEQFSDKKKLETFPCWSPDGKYLYYCCAASEMTGSDMERFDWLKENHKKIRYDLMRVGYDLSGDKFGEPEVVLSAKDAGKSILLPRVSPDGKFMVFCMCDYSSFSLYLKDSDLYIADMERFRKTGKFEYRKLDSNSEQAESWHCFSSNSRWMVFSSKRYQGNLFTRLYLCYIDDEGKSSKAVLLPQRDPGFYDSCLDFYGLGELIKSPIRVTEREFVRAIKSQQKIGIDMPVTGATFEASQSYSTGGIKSR